MKDSLKNCKKVIFEWNCDDVFKVIVIVFEEGILVKWIDFLLFNYVLFSLDMVMNGDIMVGMFMFNGYLWNECSVLSFGVVD